MVGNSQGLRRKEGAMEQGESIGTMEETLKSLVAIESIQGRY